MLLNHGEEVVPTVRYYCKGNVENGKSEEVFSCPFAIGNASRTNLHFNIALVIFTVPAVFIFILVVPSSHSSQQLFDELEHPVAGGYNGPNEKD